MVTDDEGCGNGTTAESGGRWRLRPVAAAGVALAASAIVGVWATAASADEGPEKATVTVREECLAPAPLMSNYCTIRGVLPAQAVGGGDISWEVTLFFNDQWHVQLQAFTEVPGLECQYPIRAWGSYRAQGLRSSTFVTSSGIDLGLSPTEFPSLTLGVDRVRIDTARPTC